MQVFGNSASAMLMVNLKSSEQSLVLSITDFKAQTISITSFFVVVVVFLLSHITKRKKNKIYAQTIMFFLQRATFSFHLEVVVF